MKHGRGLAGILGATALLVAGVLCFGAPTAAAKGKTVARKGSISLTGAGTTNFAVASCPKGTSAVGGGYGQTPPASATGTSLVDITDSFRRSSRSWAVGGVQLGGGTGTLTAYVYCKRGLKVSSVSEEQPVGAGGRSQATATADCAKGKSISGGFRKPAFTSNSFVFVTDNERANADSWTVTAVRSATSAPAGGTLTTIVYCAKGAVKKTLATGSAAVSQVPSTRTAVAAPNCAKGTAYAGGFRAPYVEVNASAQGRGAFLATDSRKTGNGWSVAGLAIGGSAAVGRTIPLTVLAYCR